MPGFRVAVSLMLKPINIQRFQIERSGMSLKKNVQPFSLCGSLRWLPCSAGIRIGLEPMASSMAHYQRPAWCGSIKTDIRWMHVLLASPLRSELMLIVWNAGRTGRFLSSMSVLLVAITRSMIFCITFWFCLANPALCVMELHSRIGNVHQHCVAYSVNWNVNPRRSVGCRDTQRGFNGRTGSC